MSLGMPVAYAGLDRHATHTEKSQISNPPKKSPKIFLDLKAPLRLIIMIARS